MNKWFTHYLHGVENGVDNLASAWIVDKGDAQAHSYSTFPNPKAKAQRWYLQADASNTGILAKEKGKATTLTLTDDPSLKAIQLIAEQKAANRLLFWTKPLAAPMHLSGTGHIHIQVASTKTAANLSVYLVAVPQGFSGKKAKIEDIIVNRAWADPQNHASLEKSEPLEPGKFYDLSFDFQPDDQIIPAGYQLGLMIFSSDPEFTLLPKKGTQLSVNIAESWVELMQVR